jgi:predicted Rossmann fold nucleotide-binding protein DprA/Smf involved in DNA uptake
VECVEDLAPQMVDKASSPLVGHMAAVSQVTAAVAAPINAKAASPAIQSATAQLTPDTNEEFVKLRESGVAGPENWGEELVEEKTKEVQTTLDCLIDVQRLHVDAVIESSQLPPQTVLNLLLELELRGMVVQHPGKLFTLP